MIIKKIVISLIKIYRFFISPFLGNRCRFYPSCSLYAEIAIGRHGIFYGVWLTIKRLLKCHPWYKGDEYDPVPERINFFGYNTNFPAASREDKARSQKIDYKIKKDSVITT
jgi:uncharacterized protein